MAARPHGTYARYVLDRCRCGKCRAAKAAYAARVARLQAYGQWRPLVDGEPVRAHIRALMAAGVPLRTIVRLADVSVTVVAYLLYGRKGAPPSRRVRATSAAAILAIEVDPSVVGPRTPVDASGTRRRLQALMWMGWTLSQISEEAGVYRTTLSKAMTADVVQFRIAEAIRNVYDRLWDREPPAPNSDARRRVACVKTEARRRGYLPPAAWDDDLIDLDEETLQVRLDAIVSGWSFEELRRCAQSRRSFGDRSPLTVAGAREYYRRAKLPEAQREATHVG